MSCREREDLESVGGFPVSSDKFGTKQRSKVSQASHVVSAVRRWLLPTAAEGVEIPELTATLRPLRRMLRVWQMLTPSSFRRPVWREVAVTMAAAALLDQKPRICLLILLQFHGLLRPGEARHVRWADLGFLATHEHEQYSDSFRVVGIVRPKTRRMSSHSVHQYVTIEPQRLMSRVSPSDLERPMAWYQSWASLVVASYGHSSRSSGTQHCLGGSPRRWCHGLLALDKELASLEEARTLVKRTDP